MTQTLYVFFLFLLAVNAACTGDEPETEKKSNIEHRSLQMRQNQEVEKNLHYKKLLEPSSATDIAPNLFKVKVETTKGDFVIEVHREWAPNGADRFYNLVKRGFFEDIAIFRAIDGFMFQFGIHGDPAVSKAWRSANILDDKPAKTVSNDVGTISFASGGPNTRTTQLFINIGNNEQLDSMGFTPFGRVIANKDVLFRIETKYGENSFDVQRKFQLSGNDYIRKKYPDIDFIKKVYIIEEE